MEGEAGQADCIHCLDEGMMSPQHYAGQETETERRGRGVRSTSACSIEKPPSASVAQTQISALILIISAISGFPPPPKRMY